MAVIRNSANTIMRGRVGETSYYFSGGQQIARQAKNNSNYGTTARRSDAQQLRRVKWSNLVNFYKISSNWMPKAFESKKRNQTDYNKFMQLNVNSSAVSFTKDEAAAGACIAEPFIVSQGSLPSIEMSLTLNGYVSNIELGDLTISASTTVGDFSTAAIDNNVFLRAGMQLSFAYYVQSVDPLGIPRLSCRLYEVTLDKSSTEILRDHLPEVASMVQSGRLTVSSSVQKGGFTYIISELSGGSLKVSTQQLVNNPTIQYMEYTSDEQAEKAVLSYGLDTEVILNPNASIEQGGAAAQIYVSVVNYTVDNVEREVFPGQYLGTWGDLKQKDVTILCVGAGTKTAVSADLFDPNGHIAQSDSLTQTDDTLVVRWPTQTTSSSERVGSKIRIVFSDNTFIVAEFLEMQPSE